MSRRGLLLALLVYVTLDLSLPAMPGAFVFDAAESVEGARMSRVRPAAEVGALPPTPGRALVLSAPRADQLRRVPILGDTARLASSSMRCLPRAACSPRSLSEDPH